MRMSTRRRVYVVLLGVVALFYFFAVRRLSRINAEESGVAKAQPLPPTSVGNVTDQSAFIFIGISHQRRSSVQVEFPDQVRR